MVNLRSIRLASLALLTNLISLSRAASCDTPCEAYNDILVACNFHQTQASFNSCVCNSDGFEAANAKCVACVGSDAPAASFQKTCKNVAPDCTVACNSFGLIISSCGDTQSSGFKKCVCSSAYDINYGAFNQAFNDCVACENGGGYAASYEAYCCAHGYGCSGASPQASSEAATMHVATASKPTNTGSAATSTISSTNAAGTGTGLTSGQIVLMMGQAVAFGVM